ncbi:uncharacterized protein N7483_007504 [Penicillium malachiteum]|uniref:uncharacterized protein n=1 Tax=Penicillium malachiteum TaxID=1324776 RepID=UPI002548A35F|nr:uncharacterized protein N7483_007504 [Penicillium malachiteum]KAJ5726147.1 hypothetical protein N7483_007504 [Penicillium malachiteum]
MVRSGSNFASVVRAIQASGILSDVRQEKYERFQEDFSYEPDIEKDPHDRLGSLNPDGSTPPGHNVFAFWLPHGLTNDHDVRIERLSRSTQCAHDIEDAFR